MRHFRNTETDAVFGYDDDQQELIDSAINNPVMVEIEGPWPAEKTVIEKHELKKEWVRSKRDQLLYMCDWTQVADADVDRAAWSAYRQELRNVPQQEGCPDNVVWPVNPA